jgi:integrase
VSVPVRTPSYRHHKPTGQAVVTLDGRDVYLGRYNSPKSIAEYRRRIAEWSANGGRSPTRSSESPAGVGRSPTYGSDLTLNELLLAYLIFADLYYRKGGKPTKEPALLRLSVRLLKQLYGHTLAGEFGPLALKAVRQALIDAGLSRTEINRRVGRIVRIFKWAVENEMVPANVHHGLKAIAGLKKGRTEAKELEPVKPVPEAYVEAVRPFVSRQVWAMTQLQRLTGMRPGEVCQMRTTDIDRSGKVWIYTPESHKTEHHGRKREIPLGPRAQEILGPWLRTDLTAYLFSPGEAKEEHLEERRRKRATPMTPSQRARTRKPDPKKVPGEVYETRSYYHAIRNACPKAGVPNWHPNQLRHNAATWLRKEFGLDVARVILGHSSSAVTETYAELDYNRAISVMEQVG